MTRKIAALLLEVIYKKDIPINVTEKHLFLSLCLNQFAGYRPTTLLNKTPSLVFPCEFYENSHTTLFVEHLRRTIASEL